MDLCGDEMSQSDSLKKQRAWALRREGYLKKEFRDRMGDLEGRIIHLEELLRTGPFRSVDETHRGD